MKPIVLIAALAASFISASIATADPVPANIAAAVTDPSRPSEDVARDTERHPGESVAFAGLKPGDSVADLIPGTGYFTRIFSKAVGPSGHVYAIVPQELAGRFPKGLTALNALAADPAYANVTVLVEPINEISAPAPLDLVWTAQNYHDMHDTFFAPADLAKVNKAIFAALKPGGVYLVLDHADAAGKGLSDTETLHRIDPATVKTEVTAAGFVLKAKSDLLRNPADDHSLKVFDPAIRGHTDQFIFKFRKPGN